MGKPVAEHRAFDATRYSATEVTKSEPDRGRRQRSISTRPTPPPEGDDVSASAATRKRWCWLQRRHPKATMPGPAEAGAPIDGVTR